MDLRSLALFRILFGCYLLYDIYSRTSLGKYDIAWYTSIPDERSFQADYDTRHHAPIHKLWFYRGTYDYQVAAFVVTAIITAFFTIGLGFDNIIAKGVLYIVTCSYHHRNHHADGSDDFNRHFLWWFLFLPITKVWSVDAYLAKKRKRNEQKATKNGTLTTKDDDDASMEDDNMCVSGLPCLGLLLQIVLMYIGAVVHRMDHFTPKYTGLWLSEWMPPQLSAVHWAISGTFGSRDNIIADLIRTTPLVSRTMSAMAMIGETFCPLGCLLHYQYRHIYALLLFQLHFGLFLTLNLPHWCFIGMLHQVVWIPTHVWDRLLSSQPPETATDRAAIHKKTDGYTPTNQQENGSSESSANGVKNEAKVRSGPTKLRPSNVVVGLLQELWFIYMIYSWVGFHGWIANKIDRGDIAEGLRLNQYWAMFSAVAHTARIDSVSGVFWLEPPEFDENGTIVVDPVEDGRVDLFYYLKTGEFKEADPIDFIPTNMSARFPAQRWEKGFEAMGGLPERRERFCRTMCIFVNEDRHRMGLERNISAVEFRTQNLQIMPPGSSQRYANRKVGVDAVTTIDCSKV